MLDSIWYGVLLLIHIMGSSVQDPSIDVYMNSSPELQLHIRGDFRSGSVYSGSRLLGSYESSPMYRQVYNVFPAAESSSGESASSELSVSSFAGGGALPFVIDFTPALRGVSLPSTGQSIYFSPAIYVFAEDGSFDIEAMTSGDAIQTHTDDTMQSVQAMESGDAMQADESMEESESDDLWYLQHRQGLLSLSLASQSLLIQAEVRD